MKVSIFSEPWPPRWRKIKTGGRTVEIFVAIEVRIYIANEGGAIDSWIEETMSFGTHEIRYMEFWDRPMGFTWFLTETGQLAYSKRDVLTGVECCVCETTNGLTILNGVHGYDFIRGWRRHRGMEKGILINGKEGYYWSYGSAQWRVEVETGIISFACGLGRFLDRWKNRLSRKSWKTGILDKKVSLRRLTG